MTRVQLALALVLGLLTMLTLSSGHRDVGYTRDEGFYFDASRHYAAWLSDGGDRDKRFGVNREHPPLMKTAAGLSARLLAKPPTQAKDGDRGGILTVMPEGAAMRLPAQILAGLGVTLLFIVGCRRSGLWSGFIAAGAFILLPRVWFHAGLHAFDVPIAIATLAVALAYRRALSDRRFGIALGPMLGIAIVIKHNALFIGPMLALHYYGALAWNRYRLGRKVTRAQLAPLPLVSMATLGPLTAWALWPWMWTDTIKRFGDYLAFHSQHNWYNIEFLGQNYNQPPMPISYPAVMTWATVPTVLLVLTAVGLFLALRADVKSAPSDDAEIGSFARPLPKGWADLHGVWLAIFSLFPLVLIAWPWTPIFGGTKHWITAYPFFALASAHAFATLSKAATLPRYAIPVAAALCLAPGAIATADAHPLGLSQYAPLAGGPRGAAKMGLCRGFWGHALPSLLPTIGEDLPRGGPMYLHDVHELARRQYAREGRWPTGVVGSPIGRAEAGLLFHELHMTTYEVQLWERFGDAAPTAIVELDDVPLTSLYEE